MEDRTTSLTTICQPLTASGRPAVPAFPLVFFFFFCRLDERSLVLFSGLSLVLRVQGPKSTPPPPLPTLSFSTSWLVKSTSAGGREHVWWGSKGACELRPKGGKPSTQIGSSCCDLRVHCTREEGEGDPHASPHQRDRVTTLQAPPSVASRRRSSGHWTGRALAAQRGGEGN